MSNPAAYKTVFIAIVTAAGVAACSTPKPLYEREDFATNNPFSREYPTAGGATCEAARRALLSQGYVIILAKADVIDARKSFQSEDNKHFELEFHVVCATDDPKGNVSTAFVNALQDQYALKKIPSSASLGVGAVGAFSLPIGSSDDSLVKVASETIHEQAFYDRFFDLVQYYLVPGRTVPVDADPNKDKDKDAKKPDILGTPHSD